jgi:hypothetical protein
VKSDLETLNPTRVKLTVEVPFDELKPSLDAAYKKIAGQVNIPGFRKGRVPPRVIDQRFGPLDGARRGRERGAAAFYGQAVEENSIKVLGQPEVDVTTFDDGTSSSSRRGRHPARVRAARLQRPRGHGSTTLRSPTPRSTSSSTGCATGSPP